jgi:general stress protein CsbA
MDYQRCNPDLILLLILSLISLGPNQSYWLIPIMVCAIIIGEI